MVRKVSEADHRTELDEELNLQNLSLADFLFLMLQMFTGVELGYDLEHKRAWELVSGCSLEIKLPKSWLLHSKKWSNQKYICKRTFISISQCILVLHKITWRWISISKQTLSYLFFPDIFLSRQLGDQQRNIWKTFDFFRYLTNYTYYKCGGPMFFYTGNEGSIEGFANATVWIFKFF